MEEYNFVLLHGWKQNSLSMEGFKSRLKKFGKIISIELPILKKDDQAFTIDDYIKLIESTIQDMKSVVLIGHSFGGKLAAFYAYKHDVKGLVLIAPSVYKSFSLKTFILIKLNKLFVKMHLPLPPILKGSNDYKKLNYFEKRTFKNVLKYLSKEELKQIKTKTLVIAFDKDKQVKLKDLKTVSRNVQNSKLIVYKGNHFSYLDNIDEISYEIGKMIYEI